MQAPLLHLGSAGPGWHHPHSRGRGQSQIAGTSPMSRAAGVLGAATTAGAWGGRPESQILPGWKDHSCGPAGLLLPSYLWPWVPLQLEGVMGIILLLLSGSWRLQAQSLLPQGRGSLLGDLLLVSQFCLLMCSNPLTFVYTDVVDISGILVCWAGEPLWSYERFTSFRLKERDKERPLIPT